MAKTKTKKDVAIEPTYDDKRAQIMTAIMLCGEEQRRLEEILIDLENSRKRIGFKWYN